MLGREPRVAQSSTQTLLGNKTMKRLMEDGVRVPRQREKRKERACQPFFFSFSNVASQKCSL